MDVSFTENTEANGRYRGYNPSFVREVWAKRRRKNADLKLKEKIRKKEKLRKAAELSLARREGGALDCMIFIKAKCAEQGITYQNLIGRGKRRELTDVRHAVMVDFCAAFPHLSLPQVASFFCRDHTTIIHALKKGGVYEPREMAPTHMSSVRRNAHGA